MIIFVVVFCNLLRNIFKCNCSPYSILVTMYLPGAILCSNVLYPFIMRKVHLVNDHVVYVYWIDTAYVQNNIPTEFSKRTIFII